ncbi:MAG: sensor histidine kinase [Spirosomataceae bacterium]
MSEYFEQRLSMGSTDNSATLIIIGTMAMLLMAVFVVMFMAYYHQRQLRQREELNAMEEAYQKQLLEASLQVQEAERRRIAADLHDDIGTMLSATRLNLTQATKHLDEQSKASVFVQQTKEMLDEAIQNVRRISKELLPSTLDNFGLIAALDEFAHKMTQHTGVSVRFNYDEKPERFDTKIELAIFRIAQELVNNSLKHSGATEIELSLMKQPSRLLLTVQDNGQGFDLQDTQQPNTGLGLKNIESRLSVISGRAVYDVAKGKGSYTIIEVPIYSTDLT